MRPPPPDSNVRRIYPASKALALRRLVVNTMVEKGLSKPDAIAMLESMLRQIRRGLA